MNRWILGTALAIVIALLAALLVMVVGLTTRGVPVRLVGPVALQDPVVMNVPGGIALREPVEIALEDVSVRLPQPLVVAAGPAELGVNAAIQGLSCPQCGNGILLPVRWNLFTGEITWRCAACGQP